MKTMQLDAMMQSPLYPTMLGGQKHPCTHCVGQPSGGGGGGGGGWGWHMLVGRLGHTQSRTSLQDTLGERSDHNMIAAHTLIYTHTNVTYTLYVHMKPCLVKSNPYSIISNSSKYFILH